MDSHFLKNLLSIAGLTKIDDLHEPLDLIKATELANWRVREHEEGRATTWRSLLLSDNFVISPARARMRMREISSLGLLREISWATTSSSLRRGLG